MILARPLFGTLDIALFAITLTLIAFFVVKKNWRGWWVSRKSKKNK